MSRPAQELSAIFEALNQTCVKEGLRFALKMDCTVPANAEAMATSENDKTVDPSKAKKNTGE
jgi:hypothetical protein